MYIIVIIIIVKTFISDNWFYSPPANVHGVGITSLSSFYPDSSYQDAFDKAVEDLNSNTMALVTHETFLLGDGTYRSFDEFAIDDRYDINDVTPVDSMVMNGWVYYKVTKEGAYKHPASGNLKQIKNPGKLTSATQYGDYWYATGSATLSEINPYRSWAEAKKNALKIISSNYSTLVQNLTKRNGLFDAGSIRYTRSRVMMNNVIIVNRKVRDQQAYCTVAIHKNDIIRLSNF